MKYSITVLLWSAFAVIIFTRTLAYPASLFRTDARVNCPNCKNILLHSTNTRHFVRIKGRQVDGMGLKTDQYAKLQLISVNLGGSVGVAVKIKSLTEGTYLCVNSAGDLTVEVNGTLDRCAFEEETDSLGYTVFKSTYNSTWYLGFKRSGRVKQPHNTTIGQKAARFLVYD